MSNIEFEYLQDLIRKVYRREVLDTFSDVVTEDITQPRSSLRKACLPEDDDTGVMLLLRMFFFYIVLRRMQDVQAPIYGIPTGDYDMMFKHKPQIVLYFREDAIDVDPDFAPVRTQVSFRLMDETTESITNTTLTTLANRIKTQFSNNNGYVFRRGKVMVTYTDKENGYQLKLFVFNRQNAVETIQRALAITNTTFREEYLNISENDNSSVAYPTLPPNENILGKLTRLPRKRPVADVRFTHATCSIWGKTKPVALIDRRGLLRDALVSPV